MTSPQIRVTSPPRRQLLHALPHPLHAALRRPSLEEVHPAAFPLPDPTAHALAQMAAEEVEALLAPGQLHPPRLVRMQLRPSRAEDQTPPLGLLARPSRAAHHHEVVRVAHQHAQLRAPPLPRRVEHVQVDVGQQRRDHPALRRARQRRRHHARPPSPLPEPLPQQLEHAPVRDAPLHELHQLLVVDAPEVVADVGVEHVVVPPAPSLRRVSSASSRSAWAGSRTSTDESPPRRSAPAPASPPSAPPGPGPSGSPAAASFRRPSECTGAAPPAVGTRLLAARRRSLPGRPRRRTARPPNRLAIDARRAPVPPHPLPRLRQDVTPLDAVVQRVEAASRLPLGRGPQSALQLSHFVAGLRHAGWLGPGVPAMPSRLPPPPP